MADNHIADCRVLRRRPSVISHAATLQRYTVLAHVIEAVRLKLCRVATRRKLSHVVDIARRDHIPQDPANKTASKSERGISLLQLRHVVQGERRGERLDFGLYWALVELAHL